MKKTTLPLILLLSSSLINTTALANGRGFPQIPANQLTPAYFDSFQSYVTKTITDNNLKPRSDGCTTIPKQKITYCPQRGDLKTISIQYNRTSRRKHMISKKGNKIHYLGTRNGRKFTNNHSREAAFYINGLMKKLNLTN